MRILVLFPFFLGMLTSSIWGQSTGVLVTDRPGQAIAAKTAGAGAIQVQLGTLVQGEKLPSYVSSYHVSELVVRWGLGDRFELNALVSHEAEAGNRFLIPPPSGISNLQAGMRFQILEGNGLKPDLAFQYRLKLRAVSEAFRAPTTASQFVFSSSQSLTEKLTLVTNLGMDWDGYGSPPQGFYAVNVSFPLAEKLGFFIENYGSFGSEFRTHFDTGIGYLINNGLQLDFSLGGGRNYEINDYFIGIGLSWRILP